MKRLIVAVALCGLALTVACGHKDAPTTIPTENTTNTTIPQPQVIVRDEGLTPEQSAFVDAMTERLSEVNRLDEKTRTFQPAYPRETVLALAKQYDVWSMEEAEANWPILKKLGEGR